MTTERETRRQEDRARGARLSTPAAVELHIEELVLHGFASGDRYRIAEAVQSELTRLLAEQGASPASDVAVARLDGGVFEVSPGSKPEAVGRQVAQAIHRVVSG